MLNCRIKCIDNSGRVVVEGSLFGRAVDITFPRLRSVRHELPLRGRALHAPAASAAKKQSRMLLATERANICSCCWILSCVFVICNAWRTKPSWPLLGRGAFGAGRIWPRGFTRESFISGYLQNPQNLVLKVLRVRRVSVFPSFDPRRPSFKVMPHVLASDLTISVYWPSNSRREPGHYVRLFSKVPNESFRCDRVRFARLGGPTESRSAHPVAA
jgi:hypothetical protein